ncbi:hypothetical protein D3C86_1892960 [compost metagenome]
MLYEFRESDLITRYPKEAAELLVYFCGCNVGYLAPDIGQIARRLPELELDLRRLLDEGLALIGANG